MSLSRPSLSIGQRSNNGLPSRNILGQGNFKRAAFRSNIKPFRVINKASQDTQGSQISGFSATPPAAAAPQTPAETFSAEEIPSPSSQFIWNKCWYPLTSLDYLDPSKPTQVTVLGYNLAVWRDASGEWRAFRDICPHRAAPLSEGAINPATGALQCAYHGWEFYGNGQCSAIPQSQEGKPLETATSSPRACAKSFPTATAHGLLWAWLEPGSAGLEDSATVSLPGIPSVDPSGVAWFPVASWYVRDLEVDYVALMENSADPSHVHFTHAGFIGGPERAGPLTMQQVETVTSATRTDTTLENPTPSPPSFRFEVDDPQKATFRHLDLRPPCMLWACSEGMDGGELGLLYFIVPIAPGRSRLFSRVFSTAPSFRRLAALFTWLPWLRHLYNHTVVAQDVAILHRQATNMEAADFPGWKKGFYLPTGSDGGVAVLRKWLEGTAGGGVVWGPDVNPSPVKEASWDRASLFDNYKQHTLNCPHCLKALGRVRAAISAALGVSAVSALWTVYLLGKGAAVRSGGVLGLGVVSLVALGVRAALKRLEGSFLHTEWHHADNKKLLIHK